MVLTQALDPFAHDLDMPGTADEVIARYWVDAYRFAAMLAHDAQESQDIAQDALLLVVRKLDRFDPARGSFESWLWRIVLNVARDAGRASVRRASLFDRVQRDAWTAAGADVEDIALQNLGDAELLGAVRALNRRPRTLLALRFGARLSYPEIGAQLGISEAAAIMATRRALAHLRRKLEEVV